MSFNEVKDLRKAGNLDDALALAKHDLEQNPYDIWNKRSIAWVYYDFLKLNTDTENCSTFINYLDAINRLELPPSESMIYDQIAWQVGKLVFNIASHEEINYLQLNSIFDQIKSFHFTKPSEGYSFMYKAFHKCYRNWSRYFEFADWWGFNNFMMEDYKATTYKGIQIMSIVEQAHIAYSKKLLANIEFEAARHQSTSSAFNDKAANEHIRLFIDQLNQLIHQHSEYQYPPYYKTKLLLSMGGSNDEILNDFLPFAKKKNSDFWVWELLSDMFPEDDERRVACLCKALSLNVKNDFVINTRQKLAKILIEKQMYPEAKTEIIIILSTRENNKWQIPNELLSWSNEEWYKNTSQYKTNRALYEQYKEIAEEVLYSDIKEEVVVVEFVNESKSILNFIKDRNKSGFFSYRGLLNSPKVGNILKVRLIGDDKNGYFKALSVKKINDESVTCDAIKSFDGIVKTIEHSGIGFVDDVFIPSNLIKEHNISNEARVKGMAMLSFNKKKNVWGWRAYSLKH